MILGFGYDRRDHCSNCQYVCRMNVDYTGTVMWVIGKIEMVDRVEVDISSLVVGTMNE